MRIEAPVISGLAIGVVFVLLFSYSFNTNSTFNFDRPPTGVKIEPHILPSEASVGEMVPFTVRITGTVSGCVAPPHAEIRDAQNKTVWDSGFSLVVCDPDEGMRPVNIQWSSCCSYIEDGIYHDYTNMMVAEKPGMYELIIEYADAKESWTFTVESTAGNGSSVDSVGEHKPDLSFSEDAYDFAIEITSDLNEVKEFFSVYPNANTTVYFITMCADESCSTLKRIPSIVEYRYEAEERYAQLRVTVNYEEGEATFSQVSCSVYGVEEESVGMYGAVPLDGIAEFLHDSHCPDS